MSTQRTASGQEEEAPFHVNKAGKHVHHGRTPAAWVGAMCATVAFVVGGIALVAQVWWLFWASAVLLVVGVIAGFVMQKMGYGAY